MAELLHLHELQTPELTKYFVGATSQDTCRVSELYLKPVKCNFYNVTFTFDLMLRHKKKQTCLNQDKGSGVCMREVKTPFDFQEGKKIKHFRRLVHLYCAAKETFLVWFVRTLAFSISDYCSFLLCTCLETTLYPTHYSPL